MSHHVGCDLYDTDATADESCGGSHKVVGLGMGSRDPATRNQRNGLQLVLCHLLVCLLTSGTCLGVLVCCCAVLQVPAAAQQLTQVLSKLRHTFVVADATLPDCPLVYASES